MLSLAKQATVPLCSLRIQQLCGNLTGMNCLRDSSAGCELTLSLRTCSYGNVAGFLAVDKTNKLLVVSFRGSRSISNWIANINFGLTDATSLCSGCKAHSGFLEAWETVATDLATKITSAQSTYSGYTLVLTGHSFGGAVAALGGTALINGGSTLKIVRTLRLTLDMVLTIYP